MQNIDDKRDRDIAKKELLGKIANLAEERFS